MVINVMYILIGIVGLIMTSSAVYGLYILIRKITVGWNIELNSLGSVIDVYMKSGIDGAKIIVTDRKNTGMQINFVKHMTNEGKESFTLEINRKCLENQETIRSIVGIAEKYEYTHEIDHSGNIIINFEKDTDSGVFFCERSIHDCWQVWRI